MPISTFNCTARPARPRIDSGAEYGYTVYTLIRQDTGEVIYVGCTGDPKMRWTMHCRAARATYRRRQPPITYRLAELFESGVAVDLVPVHVYSTLDAARAEEARLIGAWHSAGAPIENQVLLGGRRLSPSEASRQWQAKRPGYARDRARRKYANPRDAPNILRLIGDTWKNQRTAPGSERVIM